MITVQVVKYMCFYQQVHLLKVGRVGIRIEQVINQVMLQEDLWQVTLTEMEKMILPLCMIILTAVKYMYFYQQVHLLKVGRVGIQIRQAINQVV